MDWVWECHGKGEGRGHRLEDGRSFCVGLKDERDAQ